MNVARTYAFAIILLWAFVSSCPAATQTDTAARNVPTDRALNARLAALPGFADDAAFLESVSARVADLQHQAAQSDDSQRKAGFLLAAANLILAEQLEPVCTRKFLQLDSPQQPDDAPAVGQALTRADALITEAEDSLGPPARHDVADENPPATTRATNDLPRTAETLKAFAQGLRAYLTTEADADPSRSARRAASGLSVLLEDDNPQVAAAAAFWQACLRAKDPDPATGLAVLDPAVVDPPPDSLRFGFFSRLLRCRLLAARGGSAAALALLLQVEERVNDWFKAEPDRADALRACAWLRLQTLQGWHDRLDSTAQADERAWCSAQLDALRTQRFSDARSGTMLRLSQSIPIIARSPGPDAGTPGDATPPP